MRDGHIVPENQGEKHLAAAETSDLQVRIECGMIRFLALIGLSSFLITPLMGAAPPPILPSLSASPFLAADGATMLVELYLPRPQGPHAERTPAVVMMHGRAGAYSSAADGDYSAMTLSRRHQQWGHLWAEHGYLAILVDDFGPRGYPQGFPRFSYFSRPETLNPEVTWFARLRRLWCNSCGFASATM